MTIITREVQAHWQALSPLFVIRNEAEYDMAVERLNRLVDEVGTDEAHPLYELLDTLGSLIHTYEERYFQFEPSSGIDVLAHLMTEHGLTQSSLPEIGSQGVISEILAGKRTLNVRQIRALSQRFGVSPAVFF